MSETNNSVSSNSPMTLERGKAPFFIVGCVRSGTTMLRDVLRLHPNLACPEETHFFRWGDPLGSEGYWRTLTTNPVLKSHREIDGLSEEEFRAILATCESKGDLYRRYMALFIERRKPTADRWFDKTPQNVYGVLLAAMQMPDARFVHIVRSPLNVVASLRLGKVVKVDKLSGRVNYWNESVELIRGFKQAFPDRLHELRYEDFVAQPHAQLEALLKFLDETYEPEWFSTFQPVDSDHSGAGILSKEEQAAVRDRCAVGMQRYGYA